MQYQPIVVPGGDYYQTPSPSRASTPYSFNPNTGFSGDINYNAKQAQLGNYYNNSNKVTIPSYPTTPIVDAYGSNPMTVGQAMSPQLPSMDYAYDAHQAMYGGLNKADLSMSMNDTFNNSFGITDSKITGDTPDPSLLDNTKTAWGKMSYGEKGTAILGAATGLYGAYNAHKSGKLAKEQFNFTKDAFNKNFEAQAKTTNAQLADRQNARHARDPKAHASVSDYMKKYGV